jgi:hypothetical protein
MYLPSYVYLCIYELGLDHEVEYVKDAFPEWSLLLSYYNYNTRREQFGYLKLIKFKSWPYGVSFTNRLETFLPLEDSIFNEM